MVQGRSILDILDRVRSWFGDWWNRAVGYMGIFWKNKLNERRNDFRNINNTQIGQISLFVYLTMRSSIQIN